MVILPLDALSSAAQASACWAGSDHVGQIWHTRNSAPGVLKLANTACKAAAVSADLTWRKSARARASARRTRDSSWRVVMGTPPSDATAFFRSSR